jgi:hypothetical protein
MFTKQREGKFQRTEGPQNRRKNKNAKKATVKLRSAECVEI